ncbi:MAG: sigma 54-interacting transcriptional regulator [Desulfobacterales bacterium]
MVENQTCDQQVIEAAIEKQITLENEGIYKPIGRIIMENNDLIAKDLRSILQRQGEDMLRTVSIFKNLPAELIAKIAEVAEYRAIPKGTTIIHQGDQGDSFYQLISGSARVFRISEDGIDVTLNIMGPGESFGEMALLTGEPRSASVKTQEPCGLLVISKQAFDQLSSEIPEFSLALSKILSNRLNRGGVELVNVSATEKAYQRFISKQSFGIEPKLIGRSRVLKRLQDEIKAAALNDRPVLVLGESGTEKGDVAGLIHWNSRRKEGPFLSIDIKTVSIGRSVDRPKKLDPIRLELAQSSALFGHAKGTLSFAPERRLGLFQIGDGGTVVLENIESLTDSVQNKLVDFIQHGRFKPSGDQTFLHSSIRVMATSSVDLNQRVQEGTFNKHLLDILGESQILTVPPLRKRKKDLRLLTEHLIEHYSSQSGKSITGIDLDAYKSIMAYDWPGNTDELGAVIRRGVNLAQNSLLIPEDILIGTAPTVTERYLLNVDRIRRLFQSRAFPGLAQLLAAVFFILIIYLGLFGTQAPTHNVSLELTWGLWEPLVILSGILAARIWCAVCPVGASSTIISRKYGLNRNVPSFIRNYGSYLAIAGIAAIFWSEVVFNMPFSPRATAILVLSISAPALILALVYRRRVWCRFLCPLGKLVGFLSRCSIVELRANQNICNNDCTENSCYVGKDQQEGCPVFEAPFILHNNQDCILCGNCVKNCANQVPALNLRIPGQELWTFRKPDLTMALLVSVIMGTQFFRGMEKTGYFHGYAFAQIQPWIFYSVLMVISTSLAFLFIKISGNAVLGFENTSPRTASNLFAYSLVPMVVIFELSFHFERMLSRGTQLFPTMGRQIGVDLNFLMASMSPWLIKFYQTAFILIGVFASKAVLTNLSRSRRESSLTSLSFRHQWPILLLALVYISLFWAG